MKLIQMVLLLLELEFHVLTRMKKRASRYPKKSASPPQSQCKSKKGKVGGKACCYHSVTLFSSAPSTPSKRLSSHHILLIAFLSCTVEAKYTQPSLLALYKVTANQGHHSM